MKARLQQAHAEIEGRLSGGSSDPDPSKKARLIHVKRERVDEAMMQQRLRVRMLPARRASIGPGSRRPRVAYYDDVYRYE